MNKKLVNFTDTGGIQVILALRGITGITFDPSSKCFKVTTYNGPTYYTKDAEVRAAWISYKETAPEGANS